MEKRKRILIIDDEEDFCAILKETLEDQGGFEADFITDPRQAEAKVNKLSPDLVLIDNVMPGRNGADVVKALRDDPKTKQIPLIMVSGRGEMVFSKKQGSFKWLPDTKVVQERGEMPAEHNSGQLSEIYHVDEYLSKPVSSEIVMAVIQKVLGSGPRSSG